jgi:hypothetical protein
MGSEAKRSMDLNPRGCQWCSFPTFSVFVLEGIIPLFFLSLSPRFGGNFKTREMKQKEEKRISPTPTTTSHLMQKKPEGTPSTEV